MCNEEEIIDNYRSILFICSLISCFSSLSIICLFLYIDRLNGLSFRILFYMAISDLLRSITLTIDSQLQTDSTLCAFLGYMTNCTFLMIAIWSLFIIFILFRIYSNFPLENDFYVRTWTVVGFVVVPIFQLLPLSTESYGFNQGSCTYKNDLNGIIWRSVHEIFTAVVIAVAVLACFVFLVKKKIFTVVGFKVVIFEKGLVYAFIFLITMLAVIVYRYLAMFYLFCDIYVIGFFAFTCSALHGFFNFLALISNKSFRKEVSDLICRHKSRTESVDIVKRMLQSSESKNSTY